MPKPPEAFSGLLSCHENGVRLVVKAKPGSSRACAPRIVPLAEDKRAVEIAVAAAPEDGKANKSILAYVATALSLRKRDVSIKTGSTGRLKTIHIEGEPIMLASLVTEWLKSLPFKQG
jgi:uncharacterized protein